MSILGFLDILRGLDGRRQFKIILISLRRRVLFKDKEKEKLGFIIYIINNHVHLFVFPSVYI